ncbi:MAG: insulinase family protein, partial [Gammaproteobacteria bacterium]
HILEHTALCGSERYPVRDPFFMMTRRSLNTFMNAFTSSDWTAYPFASQNRKDFFNLLDVYLDSVFFARLDPLDFAQEGHRLEFADPKDSASPLEFKGVVYNEMKGAMSSISSQLWQTLTKYLFPYTTYHYNSGGDPEHIPDLSYEGLVDFYRSHYHPSNSVFMTYGDIPVEELHARIEERALGRFEHLDVHIAVPDEKRYVAPLAVEEAYAWEEEGEPEQKSHVILGWLLGKSTSLEELLEAHLLNGVLLDNSASPLQQVLETTDLGAAPSPLCGIEDSQREIVFMCGLEGSEGGDAVAIETMITETLERVAAEGVPIEQVRAVLHQLELHQREISGDGYPFGLQLGLMALTGAIHRGDPVAVLDLEPVLEKLHREIEDPAYIRGLVRRHLL